MTVSHPRDSSIAIVGDGFGSLIVYSTAVYLGFHPEQLTIYGESEDAENNHRTRVFQVLDGAGVVTRPRYARRTRPSCKSE